MSVERTRELALAFAQDPRPELLAEDAEFILLESDEEAGGTRGGREVRGRAAIVATLLQFYDGEGTTHTVASELVVGDGRAMVEVAFLGRHLGEFFGLPTAPRPVVVPCELVLTVEGDRITAGYVTFDLDELRREVGASPP